ncbi:DNA helicase RecQ [Cytophagaceae bacterium DM2B3-1]|uniref:DNA helicase RecQ n=1 Tax=Xanthocytophaga flava TaxID=3048013 RepID=A0ABT7CCN8_9BACT|nr:DNA helicase RecQ [Xanthocytophaga flavus]MDJ1491429.1 DNA helicase RecQ [Xanthocytophaga flavus]
MTKEAVLKQYFGYDAFRPLQAEIIDTILGKKDCLVLMPTGGGKSICYQVPAMVLPGITVVISPLIALMKDQVQALKANGIEAAYINSTLNTSEQNAILKDCESGKIKIIYVSPEKIFANGFLAFLHTLPVNLFAVDESHCVSFWGHDFRPEYTQLSILKESFPEVPVVALTATADKVTRKDILQQLDIAEAKVFIASFDRPNLSLTVLQGRNRMKAIHEFLLKHPNQPGIVYCLSRKSTESVAAKLNELGYKTKYYHAGMDNDERSTVQDEFLKDDVQIIVATIAFGMGIDKSNVRWVIHYNIPKNVESYYQEIGRAGRDGLPSDTVLFYSYADVMMQMDFNEKASPERKELLNAKLDRMKQYATSDICRRRVLLSYFNESIDTDCGNCDVCKNPRTKFDGTVLAQKALSAIARTNEKVALGLLIDILRGSYRHEITAKGYQQLKTFGTGKDVRYEEWVDYIYQMLNLGIMDIAYDEGHVFKLNTASWQVLKENRPVQLSAFVPFSERKAAVVETTEPVKTKREIIRDELFEHLRTIRKKLADNEGVPAYIVFSDASLSDMAQKKPVTKTEMLNITGVGQEKFNRYGETFLNAILDFLAQNKGAARLADVDTYQLTQQLYEQGNNIEDIATKRNMSPGTIFTHFLKLSQQGIAIDWSRFISIEDKNNILAGAKKLGMQKGDRLQPLFEYLDQKHSYEKIRIALMLKEQENVNSI